MTGTEQARGQFYHQGVIDARWVGATSQSAQTYSCLPRVQRGSMYSKIERTERAVGLKVHFWHQAGHALSFTETDFGTRRAETLDHDRDVTHSY